MKKTNKKKTAGRKTKPAGDVKRNRCVRVSDNDMVLLSRMGYTLQRIVDIRIDELKN